MQNNVYINISVTWRNSYSVAQQLLRTVASLNRNGNFVVFIYSWHGEVDQNIEHTIDAQQHFDLQHVHTFVLEFSQLKNWLNPIAKTRMYLAIWKGVIIKLCEMWKKRWKLENNKKVVALVNQLSMETTTWWGVGREKENRKKPIFCCICARMSMAYRKFGSEIKLVELVEEGAWTARYRPWEKLKGNLADAGPPLNVTLTEECEPADDVVNSLLDRSMMMIMKNSSRRRRRILINVQDSKQPPSACKLKWKKIVRTDHFKVQVRAPASRSSLNSSSKNFIIRHC